MAAGQTRCVQRSSAVVPARGNDRWPISPSTSPASRARIPFWLASAPPTNTGEQVMRAFDAGWGGAVWKTLGDPIVNVSSPLRRARRTAASGWSGFNNIELITDRPLEVNLREISEVKKRYPEARRDRLADGRDSREDWHDIIKQRRGRRRRRPRAELRLPARHVRARHGLGGRPGAEGAAEITSLGEGVRDDAGARQAHAERRRTSSSRAWRRSTAARDGLSLINTIKSLMGVDLDRWCRYPRVGATLHQRRLLRPGGEADRAPHGRRSWRATPTISVPISGIGGISTWRDAAEFIALGATSVQVCTAVMHYGFRIVEDMIDGLDRLPRRRRAEDGERAPRRGRCPRSPSGATST